MAWNIQDLFLSLPPVKAVLKLSKRILPPGFEGLSLYEVALFFIKGVQKGSLTSRASAISFQFFLAIFPAILFFFTLIPYIPVENFQFQVMALLRDLIPEYAFYTIESTITDILIRPRSGLLSVGFLMALYFSTSGMLSILDAFEMTVHHIETKTGIKQRLIAIFLVILITVLTIIAIALITTGTFVFDFLREKQLIKGLTYYYLLQAAKWLVIVALLYFAFSSLYYFALQRKKKFRFFSAGSSLATVLAMLISLGFDFYISNFSKYNVLYGSIGTLIIILLWIYFNSLIVLIGFELNASIVMARRIKARENNQEEDTGQ